MPSNMHRAKRRPCLGAFCSPINDRKARLAELLSGASPPLHYSDYHRGQGPTFHAQACKLDPDGRLVYAGRAGTGIDTAELERLWRRLQPVSALTWRWERGGFYKSEARALTATPMLMII